jgi:hypothetical protein
VGKLAQQGHVAFQVVAEEVAEVEEELARQDHKAQQV